MHTKTAYTHNILNKYLYEDGHIDISYFAHCVQIVCDNDRPLCEEKYNTRRRPRAVAISWLMAFINSELKFSEYTGFYATNKQVIEWDRTHGGQLEKVLDLVENYINQERNEMKF